MSFIISHAEISTIVVSVDNLKIVNDVRQKHPNLRHIIVMDDNLSAKDAQLLAELNGTYDSKFSDVEKLGAANPFENVLPASEELYTICYTSGTTGDPKGAMLTHGNLMAAVTGIADRIPADVGESADVVFSYLPLAHIYERVVETNATSQGHAIGFFQGVRNFLPA